MSKFYINVYQYNGDKIAHKYVEDGERKLEIVDFQPIRGYKSKSSNSGWKDIYGNNLEAIRFDNISACKEWKKQNQSAFEIYGDMNHPISYITENYTGEIVYDKSKLNIYSIDIEADSESGGFPVARNMNDKVTAVTMHNLGTNQFYVFGLHAYTPEADNIHYTEYKTEQKLLSGLMDFFNRQDIDFLTGWYLPFDIPYLIDRVEYLWGVAKIEDEYGSEVIKTIRSKMVLIKDSIFDKGKAHVTLTPKEMEIEKEIIEFHKKGESKAKEFSPDRSIYKGKKTVNKRQVDVYRIQGIVTWDYLDLYQKFTFDNKESYTLDNIAILELGDAKLSYKDEYESLYKLYRENYQLYVSYNIKDCDLIYALDNKLKFIDIALSYCYMMKVDPENIFGTVRPWDAFLYNELYYKHVLCSPSRKLSREEFAGGFVQEPIRGMHDWVTVYDIVSSYPNQIISSNLSPETIMPEIEVQKHPELLEIRKLRGIDTCLQIENIEAISETLRKFDVAFTPNGQFFYRKTQGFIPEVVERVFNQRKEVKVLSKKAKTPEEKAVLDSKSQVLKIAINSLYGATGTEHFRYYDTRISEAVTLQGQLCSRSVMQGIVDKFPDIKWVYGDTDSGMLNIGDIVRKRYPNQLPDKKTIVEFILQFQAKILEPFIDSHFERLGKAFNMQKMSIVMEHECIADISIFVEKKMYIMHQLYKEGDWFIEKPKYKIKGLAVVKPAAFPVYTRGMMKKLIEAIIETGDNEKVISMIEEFKKEFFTMPYEKIAQPRSVKFINDNNVTYTLQSDRLPFNVRAALVYNKALKDLKLDTKYMPIGHGSKIKYCYIKEPNILKSNLIACTEKMPEELKKYFEIDYKVQFLKSFETPMKAILDSIGWKFEQGCMNDAFFM